MAIALVRDEDWYVDRWPEGAVAAVETDVAGTEPPCLCDEPGRRLDALAHPRAPRPARLDIRFEIFDRVTFERIVRFRGKQGEHWKSIADGYDVLVLETGTPEDVARPRLPRRAGSGDPLPGRAHHGASASALVATGFAGSDCSRGRALGAT